MKALTTALQQLEFTRDGGAVKRMHTVRTHNPQSVAEHSYGVAWLVWALSDEAPSANLLMAALAHDVPEVEVGDIPSPTKRVLGGSAMQSLEDKAMLDHNIPVFELTEQEALILKVADMLELAFYCVDEHNLGNRNPRLHTMFHNVMGYLTPELLWGAAPLADWITAWLNNSWKAAND